MKKKLIWTLSALLLAGALAGCGKEASGYLKDTKVAKYVTFNESYRGIAIALEPKKEITDEDVFAMVRSTYNSAVTAADGGVTDRAVKVGDITNIDYCGKKDGVAFDGGTAQNQSLEIGSGTFIEGFEDGLVGVMPGETVDLNLRFPDWYTEELAGQDVVFTVTVNFIYPSTRAEMRDDIVDAFTGGEYPTVASLEEYYRDYLERYAEYNYTTAKENAVISALENIAECKDAPKPLVEKYAANIRQSIDSQASGYGVDADTFCNYYYGQDADSYIADYAQMSANQGMMFQYIANEEGLAVSDEDLEVLLKEFAEENGVESVEAMLADTDKEDFREYFVYRRVIDFVTENAVVTDK